MIPAVNRIVGAIDRFLWDAPPARKRRIRSLTTWFIRLGYKLWAEFGTGQISLRAASLVYTTILTIVPVLAVAFSLLKSLGVHNKLQPFLLQMLEPLGSKGEEIAIAIVSFVENIKVGVLGAVGLGLLLYTVISSIRQVESAFNYTWQVTKERELLVKFRDYLSVILAGPVLTVAALGLTTTAMTLSVTKKLQDIQPLGVVIATAGKLIPYGMICLSFTLLYYMLPNTKVRFRSALVGGISAGLLWQTGGLAFTSFVLSSAQYPAIYKGFAVILLFIIWLYYNWLILLVGSKISFYHQHAALLSMKDENVLCTERVRERTALVIAFLVCESYVQGQRRWSAGRLVARLTLPVRYIQVILDDLVAGGVIIQIAGENTYVPALDLDAVTVVDVIKAIRRDGGTTEQLLSRAGAPKEMQEILTRLDEQGLGSIEPVTMKSLLKPGQATGDAARGVS